MSGIHSFTTYAVKLCFLSRGFVTNIGGMELLCLNVTWILDVCHRKELQVESKWSKVSRLIHKEERIGLLEEIQVEALEQEQTQVLQLTSVYVIWEILEWLCLKEVFHWRQKEKSMFCAHYQSKEDFSINEIIIYEGLRQAYVWRRNAI